MSHFSHFSPQTAPQFLASKWLHTPFLIETSEWRDLLELIGASHFFRSAGLVPPGELELFKEQFLDEWERYLATLQGDQPQTNMGHNLPTRDPSIIDPFSLFWTKDNNSIGIIDVGQKECAIQLLPTIVLQSHRFHYSAIDGKFRRQVFGKEAISWGVQASFPTLYQDANRTTVQVLSSQALASHFQNVQLWKLLQRWLKEKSVPVGFMIDGKRVVIPFRLGFQCFSWIKKHHELRTRGLEIYTP